MAASQWRQVLLPASVRQLPADLALVVAVAVATVALTAVSGSEPSVLRVALGLVYVLFLPGYAFVAVLYPERVEGTDEAPAADEGGLVSLPSGAGIDHLERALLSFGASMAITPLVLLVLNFTPWGIRTASAALTIGFVTVAMATVAAGRRLDLPPERRYNVPVRGYLRRTWRDFRAPGLAGQLLNVVVALSVVALLTSISYAMVVPGQDEAFTEFYLLSQGDDGQLVADHYPTEYPRDSDTPLVVAVENKEFTAMDYTVVVELQRVERANGETRVLETDALRRYEATVDPGQRRLLRHRLDPRMTGQRLRLTYLLYRGQPPPDPGTESAYRQLHLWVNVTG